MGNRRSRKIGFTAKNVSTLPAEGQRVDYTDASWTKGGSFQVRVTPRARKFSLLYRSEGRLLRRPLGIVGTVSLADAREEAANFLARVQLGHDPTADRDTPTVKAVISGYIDRHREGWDTKTTAQHERHLKSLPPSFTSRPATDISEDDVLTALRRASTAPIQQNRLLAFLKAAIRWAARKQTRAASPWTPSLVMSPVLVMSRPHKEKPRSRVLKGPEIAAVWHACEASLGPRQGRQVGALIRTLLLLGQRLGETLAMEWRDLDLNSESPLWDIRPETRKKVDGMAVSHVVPLPPLAVTVFRNLLPVTGQRERVFHGVSYNSREWWMKPVREAAERLGVIERWTPHDLRRTVRTGLRELGADRDLAELIIGHVRTGLDAVYDKSELLPQRREALTKWAAHVEELVAAAPAQG